MISLGSIFIILLVLVTAVYWSLVFVILYHLTRFGIGTQPKKIAVIFLFGTVALFFSSIVLYSSIDRSSVDAAVNSYSSANN